MKKIVFILLLGISSMTLCGQDTPHSYYFYLENDYVKHSTLYHTLFNDVGKSDQLFLWCCDCIMYYARAFGISYDTMNLILFVILQPIIILMLFLLCLRQRFKMKRLKRKILLG